MRVRPPHGGSRTGVGAIESRPNLSGPGSFALGVNLALEALSQVAGDRRAHLVRKTVRILHGN